MVSIRAVTSLPQFGWQVIGETYEIANERFWYFVNQHKHWRPPLYRIVIRKKP